MLFLRKSKNPENLMFLGVFKEAQTGFEPVDTGVADHCLTTWLLRLVYYIICRTQLKYDSDGNRTRVTAVKGRCLNRLTTGPQRSLSCVTVLYNTICFCGMQVFLQIFFYFFITVQECNSYSPFFTSNLLIPIMLTVPSVLFVSISQLL